MDCVFNISAMEEIRAANEAALSRQISDMENTKRNCESTASELESEASAQEDIASSAMMTESYTDNEGNTSYYEVPDTAARAAAAAQASALRAQASALRDMAAALASAISSLQSAISETNAYMRRLIAAVQQTDLRYAQKMSIINEQIAGYTAKMQELFDSFNDSFPLVSEDITVLAKSEKITKHTGSIESKGAALIKDSIRLTMGTHVNAMSAVKSTVLQYPEIAKYADWDMPYEDQISTPFEGITQHRLIWAYPRSGVQINVFEGSKEDMKAWAEHMEVVSDRYGVGGDISGTFGIASILIEKAGVGAGKIPKIALTSLETLNSSLYVAGVFLAIEGMSTAYSNRKNLIIDETYYQEDNCCFVGNMQITGTMSTTIYDSNGNALKTWGR